MKLRVLQYKGFFHSSYLNVIIHFKLRKATEKDKDRIVDILSTAFNDNKSINFVVKQDLRRENRLKFLINYSFFMGMEFGDVFLTEDKQACAIVLYPHKKKTTFKAIWWDTQLVFRCIGLINLFKVTERETSLKKFYPNENFAHLWYIGVDPKSQGLGIGTDLMQQLLNKVKLPFYLETSTERNLPFYKKFGFEVIGIAEGVKYKLSVLKRF